MSENQFSRRDFLKKTAFIGAGVSMVGNKEVLGANEKINMGFIGIGNRGTQLLTRFLGNDDVELVGLCDVFEPYVTRNRSEIPKQILDEVGGRMPELGENFPRRVKQYKDFRDMLGDKNIDAVCIATPDHWHAVQTIQAIDAGKDVYVEKPLTITIHEGRKMIDAEENSDRIVQVGLNRRGSSVYRELSKKVRNGVIGKVSVATAGRISNMFPDGIGNRQPTEPPSNFDWDMWLGPREFRPFQLNIAPYKFRWWSDYSSQMGNWGVHYMDAIRWMVGERAPKYITAHGSKKILHDDRTIPDTMEVTFEFESGMVIDFAVYEASGGEVVSDGEIKLRGTKGNLVCDQNGYQIIPTDGGQFQERDYLIRKEQQTLEGGSQFGDLGISEDSTANLIRNFLDSVKSRKEPWCTLEEGHRSTTFAHLANISLSTGSRLEWDSNNEKIVNNEEANSLLHYEYRKPWKL